MAVKDDLKKSAEYVKRYEETLIKALNASRLIATEITNKANKSVFGRIKNYL